jgi:hypothetical protein
LPSPASGREPGAGLEALWWECDQGPAPPVNVNQNYIHLSRTRTRLPPPWPSLNNFGVTTSYPIKLTGDVCRDGKNKCACVRLLTFL